ncbi:unnamed protein product [Vitrella brassicaformis CCMP3155]|uniref:Uncharacterized protein n=2 Tax=Vitrella brassicaformis TaxID=1169539 RepID=A0A0G4FAI7_VITBC|nr:unnamed protein product [Vitrella brassicaformis CCMP3155]|eukprot:CEM09996.1 unnamed protein product [Vitrella brassicaformis CCMP3155]
MALRLSLSLLLVLSSSAAILVHARLPSSQPPAAAEPDGGKVLPMAWPEVFHALMVQQRGGVPGVTDLYYDWPNRRNLHVIRLQYQSTLYDNERQGYGAYYHPTEGTCFVIDFQGVGILTPDWLVDNSTYLGTQAVNNRTCHTWMKGDSMDPNRPGPFLHYWEDVHTRLPVRWQFFDGMSFDIIQWHAGEAASEAVWAIPPYCPNMTTTEALAGRDPTRVDEHVFYRKLGGGSALV